ncbi:hypothetical protein NMY22_g19689 [Coprinellus aureogranulatus]|nr:hypothetical protein NMY22_g19689 [Coprinellus aureogranulatus]
MPFCLGRLFSFGKAGASSKPHPLPQSGDASREKQASIAQDDIVALSKRLSIAEVKSTIRAVIKTHTEIVLKMEAYTAAARKAEKKYLQEMEKWRDDVMYCKVVGEIDGLDHLLPQLSRLQHPHQYAAAKQAASTSQTDWEVSCHGIFSLMLVLRKLGEWGLIGELEEALNFGCPGCRSDSKILLSIQHKLHAIRVNNRSILDEASRAACT